MLFTSPPEQKARPAPVITSTRTASSCWAARTAPRHLVEHVHRDGVAVLRAIEREGGDLLVDLVADLAVVAHRRSLARGDGMRSRGHSARVRAGKDHATRRRTAHEDHRRARPSRATLTVAGRRGARRDWYGFRHEPDDGLGTVAGGGKRTQFNSPKVRFTPEERLRDMDAQGVDVQVISIHTPFFGYHLDPVHGRALARDVNDEIAAMTRQWPQRFAGLATLPVQDEGVHRRAGARGDRPRLEGGGAGHDRERRELGRTEVLPLFKAAEAMGAVLFFHPQPQHNFMMDRTTRYGLFNSLGVIVEDAIVVAMLIFGGVLDACPSSRSASPMAGDRPASPWGASIVAGKAVPTRGAAPSTRRAPTSAGSTMTTAAGARRRCASCSTKWAPIAWRARQPALRAVASVARGLGYRAWHP